MKVATAAALGGADPSGGAGLATDRVTFAARGVWGRLVVTAITAQDAGGLQGSWPVPPDVLLAQLAAAFSDDVVGAVKIGMLADAASVHVVAEALRERARDRAVVLDPVLATSSGGELCDAEAVAALADTLLPAVTLVTPNLPEAARLADRSLDAARADPPGTARALLALGARAVLLKGGHDDGPTATDHFVSTQGTFELTTPRRTTPNTRGTGCALAAAIGAELALGAELEAAVRSAKAWFDAVFASGAGLDFGVAVGPLPVLGDALRTPAQNSGQGRSLRS